MPKLPVKDIDLLTVQEIGKNISGTGMDANVIGGIKNAWDYEQPCIKKILLLDLTPETQENVFGIGLAHMITRRLYEKIDFNLIYTNAITATFLDRTHIPLFLITINRQ